MSGVTFSGDPGTTGREVFEDSTTTGPGGKYGGTDTTTYTGEGNAAPGIGGGLHGQHGTGIATTGNDQHGHHLHGPGCGHEGYEGGAVGGTTGHHSHHAGHHERQEHHKEHQHDGGLGAAGTTGAYGTTGGQESHHHHGHHGHHHGTTGATGSEQATGYIPDRTGPGGPVTSGAPTGGDRLNSGSGVIGGSDTTTGLTGKNTFDSVDHTDERAAGKSSGGIMGVLGTSDKDFTGRDRLPSSSTSAYTDTSGIHSSNTSGPGGASALTGREGNVANNPVAQTKDDVSGVHGQGVTGTHAGANDEAGLRNTSGPAGQAVSGDGVEHAEGEKTGLVQKIKNLL